MHANYIAPRGQVSTSRRVILPSVNGALALLSLLALAIISVPGAMGIMGGSTASSGKSQQVHADGGFDPTRWLMCYFGKNTIPERAYQYANTDSLYFSLFSKSSITWGMGDVTTGLNWMVDLDKPDFKAKNEAVLGRYLTELMDSDVNEYGKGKSTTTDGGKEADKPKFNSGPQLNPFDRFGYAGLSFTSYQGEWKYVVIDACNPDAQPKDPKTGQYYDGRMVPQTTWEGLPRTLDIRSMQANKGFLTVEMMAYLNTISNVIFLLAKSVVAFTTAVIGFSLSDVVKIMGIQNVLVGEDGHSGVFTKLFNSLYVPLVYMFMLLTACYMLWVGLVKRQYRGAITALLRSIFMFFIAFVIAASPAFWMALPNNVAVLLEAFTISALDGSTVGKDGMCTTNVGKYQEGKDILGKGSPVATMDGNDNGKYLEDITQNMKSVVGCTLWQEFLFKPWAQGQFGTDWNRTWAKGKIPSWAPSGAKAFEPNGEHVLGTVGDAAVPMGGGKFINNWALFQLSTQTNVHSPYKMDGERSKVTGGINNDWWRVVDVISGYDEKEETQKIESTERDGAAEEVKISVPDTAAKPLESWGTWVGNASTGRMMIATSSVFIALIGCAAPMLLATMSVMYSLGLAILMMFAPIMLLFAVWADRGYELFKAWGDMVINLVIKRVVTGFLTVLSILFSTTCIKLMQTDGWWQGVITMVILSAIIVKNRKRLVDALASVQTSRFNLGATGSKSAKKFTGILKGGQNMVVMGAAGGVASKMRGGTFAGGMSAGTRQEMRNLSRKSPFMRNVLVEYNSGKLKKGGENAEEYDNMEYCSICGKRMRNSSIIGSMSNGNYVCMECMDEGKADGAIQISPDWTRANADVKERDDKKRGGEARKKLVDPRNNNKDNISAMESNASKSQIAKAKATTENMIPQERVAEVAKVAGKAEHDIEAHRRAVSDAAVSATASNPDERAKEIQEALSSTPHVPEELQAYINSAVLQNAWESQDYNYIRSAYSMAWALWCQRNFSVAWEDAYARITNAMVDEKESVQEDPTP